MKTQWRGNRKWKCQRGERCSTNEYWKVNSYSCAEILRSASVHKGINGNFPRRTQTVQSKNINILDFRSNTLSHRGYLNTFECVRCLRWHACLAAGTVKGAGLWDEICRLTSPSVAKLKTCSRTYPDWLGLLLCQLLTRQRKLQQWPHCAWQRETERVILFTRRRGRRERTRRRWGCRSV